MTVYNSNIYKIAKAILKDAPEAVKILTDSYNKLNKFAVLRQVRVVMVQINQAKTELKETIDTAKKVVHNKGKVHEKT